MSRKRLHYRPARLCAVCGKVIFNSKRNAQKALRSMNAERAQAGAGGYVPRRAYLEPECGNWHLTHLPQAEYNKNRSGAA